MGEAQDRAESLGLMKDLRKLRNILIKKIAEGADEVTLRQHYGFTIRTFNEFKKRNHEEIVAQMAPEFNEL